MQLAVKQLENLINRALEYDPGTRVALSELTGKSLGVDVTFPPIALTMAIASENRVVLTPGTEEPDADVRLRGSLIALATLLSKADGTHSFSRTGVSIQGDQDVLLRISAMLANLDIDWTRRINWRHPGTLGRPSHAKYQYFYDK